MKSVAVLLAPGFEEIEAITVIDVLRRADIQVTVAGLREGEITGSHEITVRPDKTLDEIQPGGFDMVVLPGGSRVRTICARTPGSGPLSRKWRGPGNTHAPFVRPPPFSWRRAWSRGRP